MKDKYLHITNGDGAANIIKQTSLTGDVLSWKDPMHHGPFPENMNLDQHSKIRATYLAQGTELNKSDVYQDFQLRDERLYSANNVDEVVLWFEHDLLDQLQIIQLLDWFAKPGCLPNTLSLICIDRFSGVKDFRGIGQLNTQQMQSLFETRQPVLPAQLSLAKKGWQAFCSSNPKALETFVSSMSSPLPFLKPALQRHLQEYPWLSDGLTRTERQLLVLLSRGVTHPGQLFVANMELETVLYMGDARTYTLIAQLCNTDKALVCCKPNQQFKHFYHHELDSKTFYQQTLSLSQTGENLLNGQLNAQSMLERDQWLGGVHLNTNKQMWLWDDNLMQLIQRSQF